MIELFSSPTSGFNKEFTEALRDDGEGNCAWLERQLNAIKSRPIDGDELTHVVLIGATGDIAFRLRVAQSHLRHDLKPSHWSHAVLVERLAPLTAPTTPFDASYVPIYEISLEPPHGFTLPVPRNGLQFSEFGQYDDPKRFPNIALLRVPVPAKHWRDAEEPQRSVIEQYRWQRVTLDGPALILSWLAFAWGVGATGNPIFDGNGIPSAAMIETVLNGVGFDLSPGLGTRATCPESFWQAAKWWELYYQDRDPIRIQGRYCVTEKINPISESP